MSAALQSEDVGGGPRVREGRRNFPFVKVKGLERRMGAVGGGRSLPVRNCDAHTGPL